jgi:hypothetical protein
MSEEAKNDVDRISEFYAERGIKHNPGYVYVLKAANGLYKIGKSKNPSQRISNIKTSSPERLEVYAVFSSSDMDMGEVCLHLMFEEKREMGEWFRLNQDDLDSIEERGVDHILLRCFI